MEQVANAEMSNLGNNRPREGGPSHPPGTVELLTTAHNARGDGEVILIPTPSDDPNDPLIWSMWRKVVNYGLLTAMTTAVFTALSTQTVFWAQMLQDMDVTYQDLANALAVQLAGLAVGCIVIIPFTKKYGRRLTYIISTGIVAAASWWSAYMRTALELYLTNILLGIEGATNEAAVQMSIHDMFFIHQRGTANGIYFAAVMAGSFLTPMAAGAQAVSSGWRASYVTLGAAMKALTFLFAMGFEETKFVPVISGRSAGPPSGLELGPKDDVASESARPAGDAARVPFPRYLRLQLLTTTDESLWKTFYYPMYSWWFPHVIFTSLQLASGICWLLVLASIISIVFSAPPYNFDVAAVGYMFAGPCVGTVFGSLYGGYFVDRAVVWLARRNGGLFEPEMRLYPLPLPSFVMTAGLIIFGVTADRGLHWIFPSIGGALFAFGFGAISDISSTLVLDAYPNLVAHTFVVITFIRNAVSIAGAFFITPGLNSMGVSNMFIMAGCVSLLVNSLALPLAIWGKRARTAVAPRYHRLSQETS
ncbi:putative MFS-type transporter [Tolypocladium ophioglossoides CBS 100239]|uniref:Putative MFS-type transporter n=1 Tax=Tolypocladium ophioglossoides (strain CBS 100239) TaxID=1163406 RepID=A0A0L0MZ39_TOLOC|nr:putative MFS-type transporter [Tolypocladium ophioglossoides CBS 100239]